MNGAGRLDVPVWLLDVDGVLNAMSRPGWSAAPDQRYAHADGLRFRLRWAPALLAEVRDLIRSDAVEVRWATSWVSHIDQIAGAMALPDLPLAFTLPTHLAAASDELHDATRSAKRAAALDVVASGRRLLWTDDAAIWRSGPEREHLEAAGALLIAPDERRGLQPADLAAIRAWLDDPTTTTAGPRP